MSDGAGQAAGPGPVFVPADAVAQAVDLRAAIAAIRRTYEAQARESRGSAGRVVARGADGTRIRALAAVLPCGDILGAKLHVQTAGGGSRFLLAVFSQNDGALLGLLDGRMITEIRTGATSALALDLLAPAGPLDLALLGSGREAHSHLRAIATLRSLRRVRVFSPTPEHRERFAQQAAEELSVEVMPCSSAEQAISDADTIVATARSRGETPVFEPSALRDGTTIVSVGSTLPEQRELDEHVLGRAALIVADEPAELLAQSGDCIAAAHAGIALAHKTHSLVDLVQHSLPVAVDHSAVNIFKSVGSALQDIAVAGLVLQRAAAAGRSVPLAIDLSAKEQRG
jgi:alanine dehydrogenase